MAEPSMPSDPGREPAGTPRWVKVSGLIAVAVIAIFVVLLLVGRGHGPGRHGLPPLPVNMTDDRAQRP